MNLHAVPLRPLSRRERHVLQCLVKGMSNKEIGRELGCSVDTVKVYMRMIMAKLNVRNRVEAALWTYANLETVTREPL